MTKPTDEKRRWLQHIVRHIEEQGDNNVEYAKHDRILGEPEWADVQSYVRLREIASKSLLSALFGQSRLRALFPCFKPKLGEGEISSLIFIWKNMSEAQSQEFRPS